MNVLFLGTSLFAQKCLEHLLKDSQFNIQAVVTRPEVKSQRGMKFQSSPVGMFAKKHGLSVYAPSSFKNESEIEFIKKLNIDVVIVVAYGVILPRYFLNWFPDRVVNLHTSLLPLWRGAAPVTYSLLHGDVKTGVTLQKVDVRMDEGDMIYQLGLKITPNMNAQELLKKMEPLSFRLLSEFVPQYLNGKIKPVVQDESQATYSKKIQKSQLKIDWSKSSEDIHNQIRAFVLQKGAYTFYEGFRLKILQSTWNSENISTPSQIVSYQEAQGLQVACGKGSLWVQKVQLEGKKTQDIATFIRGFDLKVGSSFS